MTQKREVLFDKELRQRLKNGVNTLADAVSCTLGAMGKNVIIAKYGHQPHVTKDGVTVARSIRPSDPIELAGADILRGASIKTADVSGDGPQPLYSKVLTPNGWVTMGELKEGDEICGTNGTTQKVLGVYPKGLKQICNIYLEDKRMAQCCPEHLWHVKTSKGEIKTIETREMFETLSSIGYSLPNMNDVSVFDNHVKEVVITGDYTEMQCIKVSNPDHLYITDDYIVTHNTSTTVILAQSIINNGLNAIDNGCNPVLLVKGLQENLQDVIGKIKETSQPLKDEHTLINVATISANNDAELGKTIGEVVFKTGMYGVVKVEDSQTSQTSYEIVNGLVVDSPSKSPFFFNTDKGECIYENPLVLVADEELSVMTQGLIELWQGAIQAKRPFVIIAKEINGEVLGTLISNKRTNNANVLAIKAPHVAEIQKETMNDIAIALGTKVVGSDIGYPLEDVSISDLGSCGKIISNYEQTVIYEGNSNQQEINKRVGEITAEMEASSNQHKKDLLKRRIANISNGIGIVYVGALTDVELNEKKDRVDDAICATKAAQEEGIVSGGGIVLKSIGEMISRGDADKSKAIGKQILAEACGVPFKKILANAGYTDQEIEEIGKSCNSDIGYDVKTGIHAHMIKAGIIDPAKVTRVAIENAVSVSCQILLSECISYEEVQQ